MSRSTIFLPVNSLRDPIGSASYRHTLACSRTAIFYRSQLILSGINMNSYCKNNNKKISWKRERNVKERWRETESKKKKKKLQISLEKSGQVERN